MISPTQKGNTFSTLGATKIFEVRSAYFLKKSQKPQKLDISDFCFL